MDLQINKEQLELYVLIPIIIIWAAWIGLSFYPHFSKKQLWKTIIFVCCSFCPFLQSGIILCKEMGYSIPMLIANSQILAYVIFTPIACLMLLGWNIADIIKYSKQQAETAERLRAYGQLAIFVILIIYLWFPCGPMTVLIGYGY